MKPIDQRSVRYIFVIDILSSYSKLKEQELISQSLEILASVSEYKKHRKHYPKLFSDTIVNIDKIDLEISRHTSYMLRHDFKAILRCAIGEILYAEYKLHRHSFFKFYKDLFIDIMPAGNNLLSPFMTILNSCFNAKFNS